MGAAFCVACWTVLEASVLRQHAEEMRCPSSSRSRVILRAIAVVHFGFMNSGEQSPLLAL